MSFDALLWAVKDAPVVDCEERAILTIMAEPAYEDGSRSLLSQKTIARRVERSRKFISLTNSEYL